MGKKIILKNSNQLTIFICEKSISKFQISIWSGRRSRKREISAVMATSEQFKIHSSVLGVQHMVAVKLFTKKYYFRANLVFTFSGTKSFFSRFYVTFVSILYFLWLMTFEESFFWIRKGWHGLYPVSCRTLKPISSMLAVASQRCALHIISL